MRQLIESINDTPEGVGVRVARRILVMTCAIWHNRANGAAVTRSLTAYDH
ncbi:hypothetical protein ACIBI9_00645 [Nonomuraea sp. NPDC050451]